MVGARAVRPGVGGAAARERRGRPGPGQRPHLAWNGLPLDPDRPLRQRLREPEAGLGSGWATWFYSNHPELFRRLPQRTRVYRARTALGPAGASWLRERVEGQFPVRTGQTVGPAGQQDGKVLADVADGERRWPPTTSSPPPATAST